MFIYRNTSHPFGLDISDLSIKAVQLFSHGRKIGIQAMGQAELPLGLVQNGEISDSAAVAKEVAKLLDHPKFGKFTTRETNLSLPDSRTFIKLITVERTPNKLADVIGTEIQKHVPFSLDEIFYDWQLVESGTDSDQVLFGAATKNTVRQYSETARQADLEVNVLEIESVPICRSLLMEESPNFKAASNANYVLLDIGDRRTSAIFYCRNTIIFTASLPIAGEDLTQEIARQLEIDREQAEKAKIVLGLAEGAAQGIIRNLLQKMIDDLVKKLVDSIHYYQEHHADLGPLSKIFLCGGGSRIKNLPEIIAQATNVDVVMGDPLVNLHFLAAESKQNFFETHELADDLAVKAGSLKTPSAFQDVSSSYATAIGLALRGLYDHKYYN